MDNADRNMQHWEQNIERGQTKQSSTTPQHGKLNWGEKHRLLQNIILHPSRRSPLLMVETGVHRLSTDGCHVWSRNCIPVRGTWVNTCF